jgi:ABC-2 type transport system permease protein
MKLLKNEIIKQVYKKSFLISLIIIAGLAVLISSAQKIQETSLTSKFNMVENAKTDLNLQKEDIDKSSPSYEIIMQILNQKELFYNEYNDIELTWDDFRNEIFSEIINLKLENYVYQEYLDGNKLFNTYKTDIVNNVYIDLDFDKTNLKQYVEENDTKIELMDASIKENDYSYVIATKIHEYDTNINYNNEKKKSLKEDYDLTKEKGKADYEAELSRLNKSTEEYTFYRSLYQNLIDQKIKDSEDYRIRYTEQIVENYTQYVNSETLSEADYEKSYYVETYKTYESYVNSQERNKKVYSEEIDKLNYAIDHGIEFDKTGLKDSMSSVIQAIQIIGIFVIIIAGGMVSNEFSKGTIRLLLTKSSKRWKILMAKLISVIIFALIFLVFYLGVAFITTSILYGIKDVSIPMLETINGKVVEINYILYIIKSGLIYMIPVVFCGILAFMFSTIISSTAFSVGTSIFLMLSSELLVYILVLISKTLTAFTFLPYMNMSYFFNPDSLTQLNTLLDKNITLSYSLGVLGLYTVIFIAVSFITFTKKDVKN